MAQETIEQALRGAPVRPGVKPRPETVLEALLAQPEEVDQEERLQQSIASFTKGLAGVVTEPLRAKAIAESLAINGMADAFGLQFRVSPEDLPAGNVAKAVRDGLDAALPDTRAAREWFAGGAMRALGSGVGTVAGGAALAAVRVPAALGTAVLGMMQTAPEGWYDAKAHGADDLTAAASFGVSGGAGLLEAVPLWKIVNRLSARTGGGLMRALITAAAEGGEEESQEWLQAYVQDVGAKYLYDDEREILARYSEDIEGTGFFAGVVLSLLSSAAGRSMARPEMEPEGRDPAAPAEPPVSSQTLLGNEHDLTRPERPAAAPPPVEMQVGAPVPSVEEIMAAQAAGAAAEGAPADRPEGLNPIIKVKNLGRLLGVPADEVKRAVARVKAAANGDAEARMIEAEWRAPEAPPEAEAEPAPTTAPEAAPEPAPAEAPAPAEESPAKTAGQAARERFLQKGSLRQFIRAYGGIASKASAEGPKLLSTFADKEIGRGTFGLGPLVHGPKSRRGAPWEEVLEAAVDAGFFPGRAIGDLAYQDFFDAIDQDIWRLQDVERRTMQQQAAAQSAAQAAEIAQTPEEEPILSGGPVPFRGIGVSVFGDMGGRGANLTATQSQVVADVLRGRTVRDAMQDAPTAARLTHELLRAKVLVPAEAATAATPEGRAGVEEALLGAALKDARLRAAVPQQVKDSLIESLPAILAIQKTYPGFSRDVHLAAEGVLSVRESRLVFDDALRQTTIEPEPWRSSPVAVALAQALHTESPRQVSARLSRAATDLQNLVGGKTSLFSPGEETPETVLLENLPGREGGEVRYLRSTTSVFQRNAPEFLASPEEAAALAPLERPADPVQGPPSIVGLAFQARQELTPIDEMGLPGLVEGLPELEGQKPVSAVDVIRTGSKAFEAIMPAELKGRVIGERRGLMIRMGRAKRGRVPKEASGFFHWQAEFVAMRRANDVVTFTHEAGHAIHKMLLSRGRRIGVDTLTEPVIPEAVQDELWKLAVSIYGLDHAQKAEGWGHFFELWALDPASAQKRLPATYRWFESDFLMENRKLGEGLDHMRELATVWRLQGALKRAEGSQIDMASLRERLRRSGQMVSVRAVRRTMWESLDIIEQVEKLGKAQGLPFEPYQRAMLRRSSAGAVAETMAQKRMVDFAGNEVGAPLDQVLAPVRKLGAEQFRRFWIYLWAQRTLSAHGDYLPPEYQEPENFKPRETGLSIQDARALVEQLRNPTFDGVAGNFYHWNLQVLYYFAQASPHARTVVRKIVEANRATTGTDHGYYVALQREFNELDGDYDTFVAQGGSIRTAGGLSRFVGSGRRVKDFLQSTLAGTNLIVARAHKESVLHAIFQIAKHGEAMGHVIRKLGPEEVNAIPVARRKITDLLNEIAKKVANYSEEQALKLKEVRKAILKEAKQAREAAEGLPFEEIDEANRTAIDLAGEMLTIFSEPVEIKGREPMVSRYDASTGKVEWYAVNGALFKALASMDQYTLPKMLDLVLRLPRDIYRAGGTYLRPVFGLVTNPQTDIQALTFNTRYTGPAAVLWMYWLRAMGHAALYRASAGSISSLKRSQHFQNPYIELMQGLGLESATRFGQDSQYTARAARRLGQGPVARALGPTSIYHYLRDLISFPELGARLAELEVIGKQVKWKPGEPLTMAKAAEMGLGFRQATTDFTALGSFVRVANQIAPFLGANFAGTKSHVEAAKRNLPTFVLRGLGLTMTTLFLWWRNRREDWYKEMNARDRYGWWHIPVTVNGKEEILHIRRAHEVGFVFGTVPEILFDAAFARDPKSVEAALANVFEEAPDEMGEAFVEWVAPSFRAPVLTTGIELWANKSMETGRPIVPPGELDLPPEEQIGPNTTQAAVFLGEMYGVSPRKVDYAIRGLTASGLMDLIDVLGAGSKARTGREPEVADIPLLGSLFRGGGRYGHRSRAEDELYELLDRADTRARSKKTPETPDEQKARLMLNDARRAVVGLSYAEYAEKSVDARRKLFQERVRIARRAVAMVEQGPDAVRRAWAMSEARKAEWLRHQAEKKGERGE